MSNNPSSTLTRPRTSVKFCLATLEQQDEVLICTRVDDHPGHCCDEVLGKAWTDRGANFVCKSDHGPEKGFAKR